jgi:putative zinc finger protein
MNCSSAESLLPLYARVDLDQSTQSEVAAHLESCAHCRQLADEYKNIQSWIRLHEPPEFSEEFFAGIRQNVWREIAQGAVETSTWNTWLRKLFAPTLPKTTFAAATAALLVIAFGIGFLVFREKGNHPELTARVETAQPGPQKASTVNAGTARAEDKSKTVPEVKTGSRIAFNGSSVSNGKRVRRTIPRTPAATTLPTQETIAAVTESTSGSSSARSVDSGLSDGQAPLRVELQTQDPNIRIIWFAHNTKQSVTN